MMLAGLFGRTSVMRKKMRNCHYDFDDVLDCWDLPVFERVCDFCKVVYFTPLCILEVIYICIRYYILSIIMYGGSAVVGMPDHRFYWRLILRHITANRNAAFTGLCSMLFSATLTKSFPRK
jgi:hypothetical protein